MKVRTIKLAAVAAAVVLAASACGNAGEDDGTTASGNEYEVVDSPDFEAGTRMADLAEAGTVKIGVKFDQPGVGFRAAGSDTPTGIDPELGKIIAGQLGIEPDKIEWVETISDNREPFLQSGKVDLVL
ncbi:transporter substrate-binding domain-containing protein, partial [Aeromicrobium sp. REDSEA-S32_B7]|uniref:transporter substrate-binding domain-containing protein n=1 Tax=Aeromicrobium sp. REDSEA-S32_B7 TaxID=1811526 RepID=UPI000B319283